MSSMVQTLGYGKVLGPGDTIILDSPNNKANLNLYNLLDNAGKAKARIKYGYTEAMVNEYNGRHSLPPLKASAASASTLMNLASSNSTMEAIQPTTITIRDPTTLRILDKIQ